MSVLSAVNPTLIDLVTRTDPDGTIADIVEILNAQNEILTDMTWQEGNLITGHKTTVRTGIPAPTWRKFNQGVQPNKSTTVQIENNCGMMEAWSEVDKALADLAGNTTSFLLSESLPHIEGMNQELASKLFFGNEGTVPEAFTGLSSYYNSLSAANSQNIIVGGGAGTDNASLWLVYWHPQIVFGIVPKGSTAGLQYKNYGECVIEDTTGNQVGGTNGGGRMVAYRSHFRWDAGLVLRDWRGVVRIPNIDKSDLTKNAATGADLADLLFQAMETVPTSCRIGRPVIYGSRTVLTTLRRQLANKVGNSTLTVEQVGGVRTTMFQGIPLRQCDVLAADETLVS